MHEQFWHERWQQGQIGFHQREINRHLQDFWGVLALPPASRVFVPLCGKSLDMLWLRAQGLEVVGVEFSPIAVRDFFAENGLEPTVTPAGRFERWEADGLVILRGNFFDLTPAEIDGCAGVFDRASLVALPAEMRPRYARHLTSLLPAHARTLLIAFEYDQRQMQGPPFAVLEDEVVALYQDRFHIERLLTLDVLADEPGFRQRGLTWLVEKVYRLEPRTG